MKHLTLITTLPDVTERGKDILLLLNKKNKKKGRIIGESVLKIWRNFSYFPETLCCS